MRTEWLTADEYYGRPVEFHHTLTCRQQKYVIEVPSNFWGWCRRPRIFNGKRGPYRSSTPAISTVADLARYAAPFVSQDWTRYRIKEGQKGPIVWEAKTAPLYLKTDAALPTEAHWLIVARNVLKADEIKYFVSNAPQDTPLEALLGVAFSRWQVERCFEDTKTELGLDHFEVRTYRALRRHLILTAISFLFVARYHQALKKRGLRT
jgi:SRSO17 transposase